MTGAVLPLIMDALVILLLAGTIFYAVRLSFYIKAFQDSRSALEKLIGELSENIEKAEHAIEGLRESARQSGRDLQETINEAQGLTEELQIMSQAGDSLAGRLEKLAEKNTRPRHTAHDLERLMTPKKQQVRQKEPPPAEPMAGFAIHDPEFYTGMDENGLLPGDYEEEGENEEFESRAERELYEALQQRKTEAGGVS